MPNNLYNDVSSSNLFPSPYRQGLVTVTNSSALLVPEGGGNQLTIVDHIDALFLEGSGDLFLTIVFSSSDLAVICFRPSSTAVQSFTWDGPLITLPGDDGLYANANAGTWNVAAAYRTLPSQAF